jgi:hypothetical protein
VLQSLYDDGVMSPFIPRVRWIHAMWSVLDSWFRSIAFMLMMLWRLRLATMFFGRMIFATPIDSINIPCPS